MGKNKNEKADLAVKRATDDINIEIINIFSKKELKRRYKQNNIKRWYNEDFSLRKNEPSDIKQSTESWLNPINLTRKWDINLTRLQIGYA